MGAENNELRCISEGCLDIGTETETVTLTVNDTRREACELIFLTGEQAIMPLTEAQLADLVEFEEHYDDLIKAIVEANRSGDQAQIEAAKNALAQALEEEDEPEPADDENTSRKPGMTGSGAKFVEIRRIGGRKWSIVPRHVVNAIKENPDSYFRIADHIDSEEFSPEDSPLFDGSIRNDKGELDREKIRQRLTKVSIKIKDKWDIVEPQSEQISSKHLLRVMPGGDLGRILIGDDWLDSFDAWIADLNESAQYSYTQYASRRDAAVKRLQKDDDDYDEDDDFGFAKRAVEDIWGDSTDADDQALVSAFDEPPRNSRGRQRLARRLAEHPVPPARFDFSADAQFMRYAYGASLEGEIDLKNGLITGQAKAELDLALAEGKVQGNCYLPHEDGFDLRVPVKVTRYEPRWEPLDNAFKPISAFEPDSAFLTQAAFVDIAKAISVLEIQRLMKSVPEGIDKPSVRIQVIGHGDPSGDPDFKQKLSKQRAQAVLGFLKRDIRLWFDLCDPEKWGELAWGRREFERMLIEVCGPRHSLDYPGLVGLYQGSLHTSPRPQRFAIGHGSRGRAVSYVHEPPGYAATSQAFAERDMDPTSIRRDRSIGLADPNAIGTLLWLLNDYMALGESFRSSSGGNEFGPLIRLPSLSFQDFHDEASKGLGISRPLPLPSNGGPAPAHHRVEFAACYLNTETEVEENDSLDLGDMRLQLSAHLGGYVGANLIGSAKIHLDTRDGIVHATGIRTDKGNPDGVPEHSAGPHVPDNELAISAFAGAKADAGLKGALEWRSPEPDGPTRATLDEPDTTQTPKFVELGSVGYTVTGLAGAGLNGSIKIGFNYQTNRFVIKAQASACLGLGFGGELAFAVSAKHVWQFIVLVRSKLREADFSFVDILKTTTFSICSRPGSWN
ncbi:OmpA family protein [Alkalilimnicola ehrlichii]|uniref:OmpA-like domain-containing protein n=1 Tax=Alkalilimnicola ehrlichii TaxID=351052 RepID=A0A3E0WG69_9GAMM|nr:OmpA family protein [Alkalilimnicola ehrlichii]RFA31509.1 hypothetical protein CAL65_22525 [Alkalilimnicola ehrlichii]